jgi:ABC-type phosphate/phosphonate transport system substrate-binding protein
MTADQTFLNPPSLNPPSPNAPSDGLGAPPAPWMANARMYSVSAAAAASWHELFTRVARRARQPLQVIDYPPPAPLANLWARPDKAAVFMCGLPFSLAEPRPYLLAAPIPSAAEFAGQPLYWSEFIVRSDSAHRSVRDTYGARVAFTSTTSQSGFAAPLQFLREAGGQRPLFQEVIEPQLTPQAALAAVAEGRAEVAAIDAYSLQLMRRYTPEVVARVRVVARTPARPIPALTASSPLESLARAFHQAHDDPALQPVLADLRLSRFVPPEPESYDLLSREFALTLDYWRQNALAFCVHPAFRAFVAQVDAAGARAVHHGAP